MEISNQLINGFIKSELELFKEQFYEGPIPTIQDERGWAIAWLCYYFKNSISSENISSIFNFVNNVYSSDNYNTHGWLRISALQASAFILTSDIFYANSLIQHIDCSQSLSRGYVLRSAGIICPLLSFDNQLLRTATETNIKSSHNYYEENIILYLLTNGSREEKVNWLEYQISIDEKNYHKKFFDSIKKSGKYYKSGFFVNTFNKAKSYILFKMFSQPSVDMFQPKLFDESEIDFYKLAEVENKHPLSDYYIDLSFLSNKT